jgi:hypothetical protein
MPGAKKRWTFGLPMTRPAPVPKLQQFALAGYLTELESRRTTSGAALEQMAAHESLPVSA